MWIFDVIAVLAFVLVLAGGLWGARLLREFAKEARILVDTHHEAALATVSEVRKRADEKRRALGEHFKSLERVVDKRTNGLLKSIEEMERRQVERGETLHLHTEQIEDLQDCLAANNDHIDELVNRLADLEAPLVPPDEVQHDANGIFTLLHVLAGYMVENWSVLHGPEAQAQVPMRVEMLRAPLVRLTKHVTGCEPVFADTPGVETEAGGEGEGEELVEEAFSGEEDEEHDA